MLPLCLTRRCAQEEHRINKAVYGWPPPSCSVLPHPPQPALCPNPTPWLQLSPPPLLGPWEIEKYLRTETALLQVCIQIKGTQLLEKQSLSQLWR